MSKVMAYTKTGTKRETDVTLDKSVFDATANHELVSLAYRAYQANGRAVSATTLTRGLVRGGGRKPWKQKGTGRARVGSIRVPNWKGGGVVFGPDGNENYTLNISTKTKRQAIRQALSLQAQDKKIVVIEDFVPKEVKTKAAVELLAKLKVTGNVLLVVAEKTPELMRSAGNIAGLTVISAKYVNVFLVMNADAIVMTDEAVNTVTEWLGDAK